MSGVREVWECCGATVLADDLFCPDCNPFGYDDDDDDGDDDDDDDAEDEDGDDDDADYDDDEVDDA